MGWFSGGKKNISKIVMLGSTASGNLIEEIKKKYNIDESKIIIHSMPYAYERAGKIDMLLAREPDGSPTWHNLRIERGLLLHLTSNLGEIQFHLADGSVRINSPEGHEYLTAAGSFKIR